MKNNSFLVSFSFSSILLLLLLFLISLNVISCTNKLIHQTCRKCSQTDPNVHYNFCVASLQATPQSHCASTLRQLGSISITLIKRNVSGTNRFIKDLLAVKNKTLDPYQRACLVDCMDLYGDAVSTVGDSMKAYRSKRYQDANFALSSVIDAATTCEDGFQDREGVVSPLTKRNKDAFQLCAIALSVIHMLR